MAIFKDTIHTLYEPNMKGDKKSKSFVLAGQPMYDICHLTLQQQYPNRLKYRTHFYSVLYTVHAPFAWGGALGEFDTFVHSSAGPLPLETLDELAD